MIAKAYDISKINLKKNSILLLYGQNEGAKEEAIEKLKNKSKIDKIFSYDEKEILEKKEILFNEIFTESLFENEKIILINKSSDKLLKIIDEIYQKEMIKIILIFNSGPLEKKSKLRNLFEKSKTLIAIPFYKDNLDTLSKITNQYFVNKKINISQHNINLIIDKCDGDRGILKNELNKIYFYALDKKKLNSENILKLINLIENHDISELIDSCLAKNSRKTIKIINENIYTNEDFILILRTLLSKSKRILNLSLEYEKNKNLDLTMSNAKPPIFWKDKETVKHQLKNWKPNDLKKLICNINEIELVVKKNLNNSLNIITDFLLNQSLSNTSN